jgi:hypothetical protein
MKENVLIAPGNRTIFMSNNSLYYNDRGKKTLNKNGFTGTCVINTGNVITIHNGKIITVDVFRQLLEKHPEILTFSTFQDVYNLIPKLRNKEVYKNIHFEGEKDENNRHKPYMSFNFSPINEEYYKIKLANISFNSFVLYKY